MTTSPLGTNREPNRQVHLDFHTSEHIPRIGERFARDQWQMALRLGRVQLINVFAKGHHSWCYYPTRIGQRHPNLAFDLLGEQIDACHEIGVTAPIYFTVGWSATDAEQHPEWCMRNPDGSIVAGQWDNAAGPETPKPTFSWKMLCPSGEYHELIMAQTEELCRLYPVDGLWYDIYQLSRLCYCGRCRAGMEEAGLDVASTEDASAYRARVVREHADALRRLVRGYHPGASVYFNGLTSIDRPENLRFRTFEVNTKHDLEDLPTTWGGYDKLPIRSKYFLKCGAPVVAMSGKFHTSWGEFGGFKHPEAIRYEAAAMTACGVRCNFGDQLHPSGEMALDTYRNIGHAYEYIERIESYGIGGLPVSNLGLWLTFSLANDEGAARMLLEEQVDFDVVRSGDDLRGFDTIVVPSKPCLLPEDAAALQAFVDDGGKLLVLGEGALALNGEGLCLDIGADYRGPGQFDMDYLVVGDALAGDLPRSPFLNYEPGLRARPGDNTEILAAVREPYFSRTYGHYCGHQNTPYRIEDAMHPGIIRHGRTIWCAHGLDRQYYHHGAYVHRALFINALRQLHTDPMVGTELPSTGRVSLLHQPDERRYVVHLLYAPPLQRGRCSVIEDMPELRDVPVTVRVPEVIRRAWLVPDEAEIGFERNGDAVSVVVPRLQCHAAIAFEY